MATTSIRKSYKFRICPNKEQTQALERGLNLCRELYNAALQERRDAWKLNGITISFAQQSRQIKEIRELRPDCKNIQARVCYQVLRQVDKAFQAFFRRCREGQTPGFPRFKSSAHYNSFFYNRQGFTVRGTGRIRLGNIGNVKIRQHREIQGTIKEVAVKREGSKWYAILSCDGVPESSLPFTNQSIGIDVGIESFATLSNGTQIENPRHYQSMTKRVRIAQRRVARRERGSNGRRKAVAQLRVIHQKILNQRSDFQHKVSRWLIDHYDVIAIEKLNIKGLARMRLAKQVHDIAWSSFFDKLRYKAESASRAIIEVDPRGTSQTCVCGERVEKSLSVRQHLCPSCGYSNHRDIVSAQVILQRAGQVLNDRTYDNGQGVSFVSASS